MIEEAIWRKPRIWRGRVVGREHGMGFVYLIFGGGRLKIGLAREPEKRLRGLQAGSPVPLTLLAKIPGSLALEAQLHKRFEKYRLHGEWFADCSRIRDYFGVS